jgi:hypothetical protein
VDHNTESTQHELQDPFNFTYFLIAVLTLALPLAHVVMGWAVFYF